MPALLTCGGERDHMQQRSMHAYDLTRKISILDHGRGCGPFNFAGLETCGEASVRLACGAVVWRGVRVTSMHPATCQFTED